MNQIGKVGTELFIENGAAAVKIGTKGLSEAGRIASTYAQPITSKAIEKALESGSKFAKVATDHVGKNPATTSSTVIGVVTAGVGLTVLAVPALVSVPCLAAVGFGSNIAAVSFASVWQGFIGNVATGSLFSILQSAGAGGYGLAMVNGAVQVGATAVTAIGGGLTYMAKQ